MPLYSTRDERFVRHIVAVPSTCDLDSLRQAIDRADADRADAGLPAVPETVTVEADDTEIRLVFVVADMTPATNTSKARGAQAPDERGPDDF